MDPTATTDLLEETWRSIIAVGQALPEEEWKRATDCPGWSVKDHVSHVIGTERMLQGLPPADVEVGESPHVKNPIGEFNEREAEARRERSGAEVLAELQELADLRLETLRSGDEAYFAEERMTPTGRARCSTSSPSASSTAGCTSRTSAGPSTARGTWAAARPSTPSTAWSARSPSSSASGRPRRRVDHRDRDHRSRGPDHPRRRGGWPGEGRRRRRCGAPIVTVTMDTETFLVLAVGRQTAEERAGQITIDGDADLGQAIVGNLNMMI